MQREIACGFNIFYRGAYNFVGPASRSYGFGWSNNDNGSWMHTLGVEKSIELGCNIGLDLSGGVLYSDNYWGDLVTESSLWFKHHNGRASGWNSYYLRAALPIALNCRATMTPYIGYNGTPDTWIGDGLDSFSGLTGHNKNEAFHGGIGVSVDF